ncbi:MAG: 3-phosphoglycerate dehydrogenase, partial [Candidatus Izemoplasmatales bacterium]
NCAIMAAKQLMAYAEKGEIINSVNYPNVKLETSTAKERMIILAKNDPSLAREIAKVMTLIEDHIQSRVSKVRGDYAFYAFDFAIDVPQDLIKTLNVLDGVNRVRII